MMPATRLTVVNAEVSDPAFGLYYLQNFGVRYRPDVVLVGLCGNDMLQAENFVGGGATVPSRRNGNARAESGS